MEGKGQFPIEEPSLPSLSAFGNGESDANFAAVLMVSLFSCYPLASLSH